MEIYVFCIFIGMILMIFMMLILGVMDDNNNKRIDKNLSDRNRSRCDNTNVISRSSRGNSRYDTDKSKEIIDDLICCKMIGLF